MAPFSVADLKEKAFKAKDASVHAISNTRDRYTSTPSKNFDYDPQKKPPPPPPPVARPSASHTNKNTFLPPPSRVSLPPRTSSDSPGSPSSHTQRDTSPISPSPSSYHQRNVPRENNHPAHEFSWTNITPQDKQVLFGWLDEYFARQLPLSGAHTRKIDNATEPSGSPPPPLPVWSRPKLPSMSPSADAGLSGSNELTSYPPATTYGSAALDLAHYFSHSIHWDSAWYSESSPIPPPIRNGDQYIFCASSESQGTARTLFGAVLFADLSLCWYTIHFSTGRSDPNSVQRSVRYLPRPRPMSRSALVEAHETYGETVAAFAEGYEGTDEYCGRGECWDLASEALKYFEQYDYVPRAVPSISRTHGHLIFEGKTTGRGAANQAGRWRGGDDRVRRGDIVEWRNVRIGYAGGHAILGNPDHTAVIVSDTVPAVAVEDAASIRPADLGTLEVVEQSVGQPPKRSKYDLSALEQGEVWIYRPVSLQAYVGSLFEPKSPDGVDTLTL